MVKETIHIACNIDTSYVKYCIVMLTSLFENNQNVSFHIHVITEDLSNECRSQMVEFVWGIERSGFFNGRGKWVKGFENQRV